MAKFVSCKETCVFPKVWDHHVGSLIYNSPVLTGNLKLARGVQFSQCVYMLGLSR